MAKTNASVWQRLRHFPGNMRMFSFQANYEREVFLLACIGLSAFYLLSLASYTPLDESLVSTGFPPRQAQNMAGVVGAHIAGVAIFAFGVTAWILPLPVLISSILVFLQKSSALSRSRLTGWTLGILSVAAISSTEFPTFNVDGLLLPSGGYIGKVIGTTLTTWLGKTGSYVVFGTIATCSLMMITQNGILNPFGKFLKKHATIDTSRPLWWDQFLQKREQRKAEAERVARANVPQGVEYDEDSPMDPVPVFESPDEPQDDLWGRVESAENLSRPDPIEIYSPKAKQPTRPKTTYAPPPVSIFNTANEHDSNAYSPKELETTAALLVRTFEDFGIKGKVIGYQPGPVVTVYEFQPDAGVKQSKILGLIDDLALALKVDSIFIHPVRGKRALGIQVPNQNRETVFLGDIVGTPTFCNADSPLTFGMGKTLNGSPMCVDLKTMPHLLAAGATGSGKSVAVNSLLCSIIMKASPADVRMILVDPKMLELSVYEGIPHLLMPVITEPDRASLALRWAAFEMERRYKLMQHAKVRNIEGFNNFWNRSSSQEKQDIRDIMEDDSIENLPYIMIVIDELADLMLTAPKDVESSIQRLAQKARASGIHMVLATQRPSVDIITGVIKANLPCRIAFQVVSKHDSRTILDLNGADKLLGKGDMLLQRPGVGRLERIQGALITDEEVLNLVAAVKSNSRPEYDETIVSWIDDELSKQGDSSDSAPASMDDDPKYDEAISIAQQHGVVSASFLQRHLKIGYNRAARIVEFMESQNLIGKADGSKPRKWLGPGGINA